jgi:hypothetical protein
MHDRHCPIELHERIEDDGDRHEEEDPAGGARGGLGHVGTDEAVQPDLLADLARALVDGPA